MPTCHWMIGPPGCGKSTYVSYYHPDAVVISTDKVLEEWAARDGISYADAFIKYEYDDVVKSLLPKLFRALLTGLDIVLDQTNCTPESRRVFGRYIPSNYQKIGVRFEFDPEVLLQRVREREAATGKHVPEHVVLSKIEQFSENIGVGLHREFDGIVNISRFHLKK